MNYLKENVRIIGILMKGLYYFLHGLYALNRMHAPIISIFGGKRASEESADVKLAYQIAQRLAEKKYAIITGGGPGLMKAANCGAAAAHPEKPGKNYRWTLGLGVNGVDNEFVNPCACVIPTGYFFIRKWLLMFYSQAFVFLPGGIGTAEELFELLDLKKHKMVPNYPVVLVDKNYWQPLIDWYENRGVKDGFIILQPSEAYIVCDTVDEAVNAVEKGILVKK